MAVLQRIITEALRLFPPLVLLLRQCKRAFAVTTSDGKKFVIPKVKPPLLWCRSAFASAWGN